ncbi:hypothetical protein MRB53_006274 [Persea americana]|uniref:Uncharacterized protein n=1 Tax=Persea americana TaxID=3435 RepID=A0ACC2MGP5_PERAE|nr:hypothetical protein MRB53_006274 [Persea americana]
MEVCNAITPVAGPHAGDGVPSIPSLLGPALDVVEPLLLAKKGALESNYATICDRVAVVTPQLESASRDLDQKWSSLTKVVESERGLVAQLECLRSRRVTLKKEIVDLDVLVKDQQCSLKLDSSRMKGLEQSLSLVDADLHKLSSDPAFLNEVRASYTSFVEFEARGCIEDVLLSL